jgi:hypothetical protein
VSDIDTVLVDSLKALDLNRPIREADITRTRHSGKKPAPITATPSAFTAST